MRNMVIRLQGIVVLTVDLEYLAPLVNRVVLFPDLNNPSAYSSITCEGLVS